MNINGPARPFRDFCGSTSASTTYFGLEGGVGGTFSSASSSSSSSSTRISATCQVHEAVSSADKVENETLKLVLGVKLDFLEPVAKRLSRGSSWRLVLCDDLHEHDQHILSESCSVLAYPCKRLTLVAYAGLIVFRYVSICPLFSVKRSSSLLQTSNSSSNPLMVFLPAARVMRG